MVQVTQTEEEIKITIELNRLITRKPDIVLLPSYVKFNNPPIFFERHLAQEIDETVSFCRIFKNEARLVLVKKQKGIWSDMFCKFSKEELMQKRLEIANQIIERNKERDQKAIERYENKRRAEIDKEIRRETAMRERVKQFEENACHEALVGPPKETSQKQCIDNANAAISGGIVGTAVNINASNGRAVPGFTGGPAFPRSTPMSAVRNVGKINVCFSSFAHPTPRRESQEGLPRPFIIEDAPNAAPKSNLQTVNE